MDILSGFSRAQFSHIDLKNSNQNIEKNTESQTYLVVPPFAAIFETNMSSSSLEDLNCKFYVLTSILALAPILHTTERVKTKLFDLKVS